MGASSGPTYLTVSMIPKKDRRLDCRGAQVLPGFRHAAAQSRGCDVHGPGRWYRGGHGGQKRDRAPDARLSSSSRKSSEGGFYLGDRPDCAELGLVANSAVRSFFAVPDVQAAGWDGLSLDSRTLRAQGDVRQLKR